jgi:hypothetical protein
MPTRTGHRLHGAATTGVPWTFGTTETYLTAAAVGNHPAIRRYRKFLRKNVKVEKKTRTTPFRTRHLRRLLRSQSRRTKNIDLAIESAFTFGQRVSDMLQLHHDDVSYVRIMGEKFLVLLVRRGKTITCTGPYTLHLPANHHLASLLSSLKRRRPAFLFSSRPGEIKTGTGNLPQLTPAERTRLSKRVRCRLQGIKPTLGTRSIRRSRGVSANTYVRLGDGVSEVLQILAQALHAKAAEAPGVPTTSEKRRPQITGLLSLAEEI